MSVGGGGCATFLSAVKDNLRKQLTFPDPITGFRPRVMTSEKRAKKIHTNDVSLPDLARQICPTNQKHDPDPGSDASSVWNFCARFSDVIWRENYWWRREMLAVFLGYVKDSLPKGLLLSHSTFLVAFVAWRICRAGCPRPPLLLSTPNQNRHAT